MLATEDHQRTDRTRPDPLAPLRGIKNILALGFLAPFIVTRQLFFSNRFYPTLPVFPILGKIPLALELLIYATIFALLIGLLLSRRPRKIILCLCPVLFFSGLCDQNRLMPYYYQFFFMLLALSQLRWDETEASQIEPTSNTLRIILASMYFWSGLQKLNVRYVQLGFPWLVSAWTDRFGIATADIYPEFALVSALAEAAIGIFLLVPMFRREAVIGLMLMHSSILLMIGPLGLNWNESVWSWNVAMMGFAWLLFWDSKAKFHQIILGTGAKASLRRIVHAAILCLFLFLPALNFVGRWDDFLSHSMYSWATEQGFIDIGDIPTEEFPEEVRPHIRTHVGGRWIDYVSWAYGVYHSSPFYSERLFVAGFKKLCQAQNRDPRLKLIVLARPSAATGKSQRRELSCPADNASGAS